MNMDKDIQCFCVFGGRNLEAIKGSVWKKCIIRYHAIINTTCTQAPVWVDLELKVLIEKCNEQNEIYSLVSFMYPSLPQFPYP